MNSEMYYCSLCDKVFKLSGPGKKAKCPHCSNMLLDMGIVGEDYAKLDKQHKDDLKAKIKNASSKKEALSSESTPSEKAEKKAQVSTDHSNKVTQTSLSNPVPDNNLNTDKQVSVPKDSESRSDLDGNAILSSDSKAPSSPSTQRFSFFDSDEIKKEPVTSPITTSNNTEKQASKIKKQNENKSAKISLKVLLCVVAVLALTLGGLAVYAFVINPSFDKAGISEEAQSVIDLINRIGEVELEDETLVAECEEAYMALIPQQQTEVSNYNTLVDARKKLDELIASIIKPAEPVKTDEPKLIEEVEEAEEKESEKDILWKNAYRRYLYDVMAGFEFVPDLLETITYKPDMDIRYQLMDITGDNIPELLISGIPCEANDYPYWKAYTFSSEGRVEYFCDFGFFDPDTGEVFVADGTSFEEYSIYRINNGQIVREYGMFWGDDNRYYKEDGKSNTYNEISKEEMEKFRKIYNDGYKKFGIKGIALNKQSVENDFGSPNDSDELVDFSGYTKMWIKEECKEYYEDWVFESYLEGDNSELFNSIQKADWDNDGINEYYLEGCPSYSGIYFDISDGRLTALYGFGPYGMGWSSVAYIGGAYWVYDASGNYGKFYEFRKFNQRHEISDKFCYSVRYDMDDASYEKATFAKGSDYENMSEISEKEFDEMCGENGLIWQDLPDISEDGNEKLTKDLYEAVKEFFEGKRPVFAIYNN